MASPQGVRGPSSLLPTALAVVLLAAPAARAQAVVDVELTEEGELRRSGLALSQRDFFELAGRRDLLEKSDRNLQARRWLLGSAAAVLVASLVVGAIVLAMVPDLDKPYCQSSVPRLDECQSYYVLYQRAGISTFAGGAAVAALLATIGFWLRPEFLAVRDLAPMVDAYNLQRTIPGP